MGSMMNLVKLLGVGASVGAPQEQQQPALPGLPSTLTDAPPAVNVDASAEQARADINSGTRKAASHGKAATATIRTADKAGKDAIAKTTDVATREAEAARPVLERAGQDSAKQDADLQDRLARIQQKKTEGLDRYLAAVEDLKNTHVYSWWAQAGTGAKVLGVISQALAGGLQGLTGQGGPSPLDRIIEQDLAVQKANLAKKSDTASQSGNLYQQLVKQFGDEIQAESAFRTIAAHSTGVRIDGLVASIGGEKATAKGAQMKADQAANTAKLLAPVELKIGEDAKAQENAKAETGLKASGLATEQRGQDMTMAGHLSGGKQGTGAAGIENFDQYSKANPEAAEKVRQQLVSVAQAKDAVQQMRDVFGRTAAGPDGKPAFVMKGELTPDDKQKVDQLLNQALLKVKNIEQLGAISTNDKQLATAVVGESNDWGAVFMRSLGIKSYPAMLARLETFQKNLDRDMTKNIGSIDVADPATGKKTKLKYNPDWDKEAP